MLIVIPARGGSKGLPGKNTKILGDIPLLGWTAEAVNQSGIDNAITVLSTDDPEIARIGEQSGISVPFIRPAELSTDTASAVDVALHALDWMEKESNTQFKYLMLLQPTSPFRSPQIITDALAIIEAQNVDAVLGVKSIYRSLHTLFQVDSDNLLVSLKSTDNNSTRRQEVKPIYTPNGAMYLIRCETLRAGKTFFPNRLREIVMDQMCSHDIDDPLDWEIAQAFVSANLTWRSLCL